MKNFKASLMLGAILITGANIATSQTLIKSESIVGGNLCHYSDGSVIRSSGYCERSLRNQQEESESRRDNRSNALIRTEPIVGGARCYYADGSVVTKRGDSYCPR